MKCVILCMLKCFILGQSHVVKQQFVKYWIELMTSNVSYEQMLAKPTPSQSTSKNIHTCTPKSWKQSYPTIWSWRFSVSACQFFPRDQFKPSAKSMSGYLSPGFLLKRLNLNVKCRPANLYAVCVVGTHLTSKYTDTIWHYTTQKPDDTSVYVFIVFKFHHSMHFYLFMQL